MAIAYFEQYPDVAASYAQNNYGLTPEAFANFHFENYGRGEQRISPSVAEVAVAGAAGSGTTITPTYTPVAAAYFNQNPDVAEAYQENTYNLTPDEFAAAHYSLYGTNEQRAEPTIVEKITSGNLTNLPKYFQDNPDVANSYVLNTYGLTPEQFAAKHFELYGINEKRTPPTGVTTTGTTTTTTTRPTTVTTTTARPTTVTPTTLTPTTFIGPTGVTAPATTAGQFRELFPSFEESKRLASEMVANRPTMQSIISMIQGGKPSELNTSNILGGQLPSYFIQNPDVAAAYRQNNYGMTPDQFAATHYQKFGQSEQRAAPTTTVTPAVTRAVTPIVTRPVTPIATPVVTPVVTGATNPYFQANPDVAASYKVNNYGLTPDQFAAKHFELYGSKEQRVSPTGVAPVVPVTPAAPVTSVAVPYFQANPDVAASYLTNNYGLTPDQFAATHYELYGQNEQRISPTGAAPTLPALLSPPTTPADGFTMMPTTTSALPAYFTQNPDVAAAYQANNYGLSPADFATTHYNLYGQGEQRAAPTSLANVISAISK